MVQEQMIKTKNLEPKFDSRFVQFQLAEGRMTKTLTSTSFTRNGAGGDLDIRDTQEANEVLAAAGLLQLADGFRFNLANAMGRRDVWRITLKLVADFFKCVAVTVSWIITQFDDFSFTAFRFIPRYSSIRELWGYDFTTSTRR